MMNETSLHLLPASSLKMSVLQTPANHVAEFLDTKGSGLRTPLSVAVSDSLGKIKDDPLQPRKLDPL